MSIYGTMRTSVSGMAAQADRLSTIGDNIANVSTNGYKKVSTEFSTLVLQVRGHEYESGAVESNVRRYVADQGSFKYTSSVTDMAVNGQGFFVVEGDSGEALLTRAGSFVPNADGELVNASGAKLLGYDTSTWSGSVTVNGTVGLEVVRLSSQALQAQASTEGDLTANVSADATVTAPADLPSANAATGAYSARTSLVSYDTLGREVTLDFYFAKTGVNAWEVSVFDRAGAPPTGTFPYASPALATVNLAFDSATGHLNGASPTSVTVPVPGGLNTVVDLSDMSQFASDFSVISAAINGAPAVPVSRYEISEGGVLSAVYANGAKSSLYQIPLASVASPDNLTAMSGNTFLPSNNSGDMQLGLPLDAGHGGIKSGSLEQSTVDIASELTAMIEAQRNYTANSRVFQAGADLADVTVNLRS